MLQCYKKDDLKDVGQTIQARKGAQNFNHLQQTEYKKNQTAQKAHKTWQLTGIDDDNFQSIN